MIEFLSSPPALALALFAACYLSTLVLSAIVRLWVGASLSELIETRFHELPCVRGLIWVGYGLIWCGCALAAWIAAKWGLRGFELGANWFLWALFPAGLAALLAWMASLYREGLIEIPPYEPPAVSLQSVNIKEGIPLDRLATLGKERFPNHLDEDQPLDNWFRSGMILTGVLTISVLAMIWWTHDEKDPNSTYASLAKMFPIATPVPQGLGMFLAWTCAAMLAIKFFSNYHYQFITYRPYVIAKFFFAAMLLGGLVAMGGHAFWLLAAIGVIAGLAIWRSWEDLSAAWRYTAFRGASDAIADDIRSRTDYLDDLRTDRQLSLPPVVPAEVGRRISHGCRNVEEEGPWVLPHFGRFMQLAEVHKERFAVASLRFLVVCRYTTRTGGCATYRFYQHPVVPVWNLGLFPLFPPAGYRNWLDPLMLSTEWDIVESCGPCGGTGRVHETETYTDSDGKSQSRSVEKTCNTCGGTGRLEFTQILNTDWICFFPTSSAPWVPMTELLDFAEEKVYYQQPLMEHLEPITAAPIIAAPQHPLSARMAATCQSLLPHHQRHAQIAAQLYDGRVFRSDFQVTGFHTLQIDFEGLPGKRGWFFGARPEFFFPQLPIAWDSIATVVFLTPLVLVGGALLLQVAAVFAGSM